MQRFEIRNGPDRMELMSNFALRNPVELGLTDGTVKKIVINSIAVESADCNSWLLTGYCFDKGQKFEGYLRTHPKYVGTGMLLGYIDIYPLAGKKVG